MDVWGCWHLVPLRLRIADRDGGVLTVCPCSPITGHFPRFVRAIRQVTLSIQTQQRTGLNILLLTTMSKPLYIRCSSTLLRKNCNDIPDPQPVDRCLSQKVDEKCQFLFSLPICLAVILGNAIKVVCVFLTAYDNRKEIFLTTGDAISSPYKQTWCDNQGEVLIIQLKYYRRPATMANVSWW